MQEIDTNPQSIDRFTQVDLELIDPSGEIDRISVIIVPDDQADYYAGYLGESTPLARAILGKHAGTVASYYANGLIKVKILKVSVVGKTEPGQAAAQRKAAVQQAITDAERTNAMIFATSVAGKWGDYDADGMIEAWDQDDKGNNEEN